MYAGGISESTTPPSHDPAGPSFKRAVEDNEVNSPPKKKCCSMEDYMKEIYESIVIGGLVSILVSRRIFSKSWKC